MFSLSQSIFLVITLYVTAVSAGNVSDWQAYVEKYVPTEVHQFIDETLSDYVWDVDASKSSWVYDNNKDWLENMKDNPWISDATFNTVSNWAKSQNETYVLDVDTLDIGEAEPMDDIPSSSETLNVRMAMAIGAIFTVAVTGVFA